MAAVLLTGNVDAKRPGRPPAAVDLSDAFSAVEAIAVAAGVRIDVTQGQRAALHPGRTGVLSVGGVEVGYVGELLPTVSADADLPGRVYVAELDLDRVLSLAGAPEVEASLSSFPVATQDVSLVVGDDVVAGDVTTATARRRGRGAARVSAPRRRLPRPGSCGRHEEPDVRDALPRDRPDADGGEATDAKLAGVATASERFGATIRE